MNKNILVTGGTGFIGSEITKYLVKKNYNVTVFDDNSRGKTNRLESVWKKIKFIKGDIRNRRQVYLATKNIHSIIHLAYINGTKFFYSRPYEILEVATKGMLNLIDACKINNIKKFYLASSSEVYQTPLKIPTDEKEMLKIKIKTKQNIIFSPHNVYSGDMGNEHVIPEFINRIKNIKKDGKFLIQGDGNQKRSFIHIDDFIEAFDKVFKKGKNQEIYNIGTTEVIKIKDLAKKISKIFNTKIKLKKIKINAGGTKIRCPNINKLKKLGFKPRINLDKGLEKIATEL